MGDKTNLIDAGPKDSRNVDISQTQLPDWVNKGSEGIWNSAVGTVNRGYEGYDGPRIADFTGDQNAAMDQVRTEQDYFMPATMRAAASIEGAAKGYGDVAPTEKISVADMAVNDMGPIADVSAERTGTKSWLEADRAGYTNPWDDAVTKSANDEIARQAAIMRRQTGSAAATAGALGGKRHGVADSLTNEAALREIASTTSKNKQAGYTNAQGMFTSDADRALTSDTGNADRALTAGRSNQATQLDVGKTNLDKNVNVGKYNMDKNFNVADANQRASMFDTTTKTGQFNADRDALLASGKGLQSLTADAFKHKTIVDDRLMGVGDKIQGQNQKGLDLAYDDFTEQRDFDKNGIDWLTGILPKLPTDKTNVEDKTTPTADVGGQNSSGSGAAGIIGGAASLASMFM